VNGAFIKISFDKKHVCSADGCPRVANSPQGTKQALRRWTLPNFYAAGLRSVFSRLSR
jgi:hypothetical protein